MKIRTKQSALKRSSEELLIIPAIAGSDSTPKKSLAGWKSWNESCRKALEGLDAVLDGDLLQNVKRHGFKATPASILDCNVLAVSGGDRIQTIRLYGMSVDAATPCGSSVDEWRKLGADAYQTAKAKRQKIASVSLHAVSGKNVLIAAEAIIQGALLASYRFDAYRKPSSNGPQELRLLTSGKSDALAPVIRKAEKDCASVSLARDLVNTPGSDLTPTHMVAMARRIARKKDSRITAKVHGRAALKKMGAGGLLSIAQGSIVDPYLIHLTYKPARKRRDSKTIVLVGKGVTFDSGGLSLKSGKGMMDMKCDMAGAACVLGAMKALGELPSKDASIHTVHALIPTVENLVNSKSVKPGDVMTAMNGKSVEILNTDAEGRLILADALSYSARLKPDVILDFATLTGACIAALGSKYSGLFSNNDSLRDLLHEIGEQAGERHWPMPLADEYRAQLKSTIADLKNIGNGSPGAVTAALFLEEFVPKGSAWAHFDIAGPAFVTGASSYIPAGGTGFGVRTVLEFLREPQIEINDNRA